MKKLLIPNITITSLSEVVCNHCDHLLTDDEIKRHKHRNLIKRVFNMQKINSGRFRVWLGKAGAHVCTEFIYFTDERYIAWGIRDLARENGAQVFTMIVHPHCDRYSPPKGEGDEVIENVRCESNGSFWAHGINHGRMETQVEMCWSVSSLSEARAVMRRAKKVTQSLWDNYGVAVI